MPIMRATGLDVDIRRRLLLLFNRCFVCLDTGMPLSADDVDALLPKEGDPADLYGRMPTPGEFFYGGVRSILAYFAHSALSDQVSVVGQFAEAICDAAKRHLGTSLQGWNVGYASISGIRQAYWDAYARRSREVIKRDPLHPVIRINDIPFAEAIFPALISWSSNQQGYSVLIEDVSWADVGAALLNRRIDVAIYPDYLKEQISDLGSHFTNTTLYRSNALLRYQDYPVLRNLGVPEEISKKIGIPRDSDFVQVLNESAKDGVLTLNDGAGGTASIDISDSVDWCESADEVASKVVDGKLEYGLVGGLQSHYALKQYPGEIRPGKGDYLVECDHLNRTTDRGECYFWVVGNGSYNPRRLLAGAVSLWNKVVVRDLQEILQYRVGSRNKYDFSTPQSRLVGMVNCQAHSSFVADFDELSRLIKRHDQDYTAHVDQAVQIPIRVGISTEDDDPTNRQPPARQ